MRQIDRKRKLLSIVDGSLYTRVAADTDTMCVWYGGSEFFCYRISTGEALGGFLVARPGNRQIKLVEAHGAIQEHIGRMRRGEAG